MSWLSSQVRSCNPDFVLLLGAGSGSDLLAYTDASETKICMVEANPESAEKLRARFSGFVDGPEVINCAISNFNGPGRLKIYNAAHLNSLRGAGDLPAIYPGLRVIGEIDVEVSSASSMVEKLGVKITESNCLLIETPGEETVILRSLKNAQKLSYFEHVIIRVGLEHVHESGGTLDSVSGFMEEAGYFSVGTDFESDPDFPVVHFELSQFALKNENLSTEVANLQKELSASEKLRKLREADLVELRERYADLASSIDKYEQVLGVLGARLRMLEDYTIELENTPEGQNLNELISELMKVFARD